MSKVTEEEKKLLTNKVHLYYMRQHNIFKLKMVIVTMIVVLVFSISLLKLKQYDPIVGQQVEDFLATLLFKPEEFFK